MVPKIIFVLSVFALYLYLSFCVPANYDNFNVSKRIAY